jgi:Flp pilus assembly protein TadG
MKTPARFLRNDSGVAAVEAAFLFPLLILILCGTYDMGRALLANQKLISAAQTVADLLAREDEVTDDELNEAIAAGRLSLMPYPTASFGVDVAGIEFVGASAVPTLDWRDSVNAEPNDEVLEAATGLGEQGEGVLAVTATFTHTPFFSNVFTGDIEMQEVAYARGRRGLFIARVQ